MNMLLKLDKLMLARGLNKHTLAEQSGIPYSTIVGIYSKDYKKIKLSTLRRLSEFFNVTMEYLGNDGIDDTTRYEEGTPGPNELILSNRAEPYVAGNDEERMLRRWRELDRSGRIKVEGFAEALLIKQREKRNNKQTKYIRLFLSTASAGYVSPVEGKDFKLIERTDDVPKEADFAVIMKGDSMKPYIEDGALVYVSEDRDLKAGDVGVFYKEGDVFLKQYATDGHNLYLLSINQKSNADITVLEGANRNVFCLGKVLLNQ